MNHHEVRRRLGEYLQGDLTLGQRALFDGHLDECPDCAEELRALRATVHLLQATPEPPPPQGLADRVLARIEEGEGRRRWWDGFLNGVGGLEPSRVLAPLSAAAVAAGLVMVVFQGQSLQITIDLGGEAPMAVATPAPEEPARRVAESEPMRPAAEAGLVSGPFGAPGEAEEELNLLELVQRDPRAFVQRSCWCSRSAW